MVSVVNRLVVILFSIQNIRWVHCCFSDVSWQVSLLSCQLVFVCRTYLGRNCSLEEKLEFKTGEDVLGEVEKFCYLVGMISGYGGASEAVSARIGRT